MDYGKILRRAIDILLTNKYLIILGILAALGSGGGSGSSPTWTMGGGDQANPPAVQQPGAAPEIPDIPSLPGVEGLSDAWPFIALLVGVLLVFIFIIWLAVLIVSSAARGGLVRSVDDIEDGGISSFGEGWRAGWARIWPLVGINILPAIPLLLAVLLGIGVLISTIGLSGLTDLTQMSNILVGGSIAFLVSLLCILVPVTIVLGLLRTFAERACMLEGQGVWASYKRGWQVAIDNIGPVIILALLQLGISIVLNLLLLGPSIFIALCCILWPIFFIISGAIHAYFSTVWTLAWREWTGDETTELTPTAT